MSVMRFLEPALSVTFLKDFNPVVRNLQVEFKGHIISLYIVYSGHLPLLTFKLFLVSF